MTATKPESPLTAALAKVQARLPEIHKDQTANAGQYSYTYADLAAVSKAILPLLGEHGLAWVTRPTVVDGRFMLAYELRHTSGETITGEYPLTAGTPQQNGSAITYARRYCLCSVTGVAPESDDDDAQAASTRRPDTVPADEPAMGPTDGQTEEFGRFRTEIQVASLVGLDALVGEIQQAHKAHRITYPQNRRLADLWQRRRAELDAKAATAEEAKTDA